MIHSFDVYSPDTRKFHHLAVMVDYASCTHLVGTEVTKLVPTP